MDKLQWQQHYLSYYLGLKKSDEKVWEEKNKRNKKRYYKKRKEKVKKKSEFLI